MAGWMTRHRGGFACLGVFALAWGAAVAVLAAHGSEAVGDGVAVMAVFGIALPALGWLLTLGETAPTVPVRRRWFELGAVLAYLALYAIFFTGWGLSAFHAAFPPGQTEQLLLVGLKLAVHVALPALLVLAIGGALRPLIQARLNTRGFWLVLIILGAAVLGVLSVISPALNQLRGLHADPQTLSLAIGASFVWHAIEAGLCEEFLFRAVLQTRLAAVLKTEAGAAAIAALVFALVHVPGLWLRSGADVAGHSQSLADVIAYAIAVLAPTGLFLGFIWARTRSLLLVVMIHALIDVLPNTAQFAHTWMGL